MLRRFKYNTTRCHSPAHNDIAEVPSPFTDTNHSPPTPASYMTTPLCSEEAERPITPTTTRTSTGSTLNQRREKGREVPFTKEEDTLKKKDSTLKTKRKKRTSKIANKISSKLRSSEGFGSGLLAIGIYALLHDSGIMTILLLAFVWWYSLEESHQRIFLFFLVILNFAEYFYLLPPVLARYQQEDWWDIPTVKKALLTMTIFWSIAWFSAATGSYLENKEQRLKLEKEKKRQEQELNFQQSISSEPSS